MCARQTDLFITGFHIAPAKIFRNRSGEKKILLQHHTDTVTQIGQGVILHVHAVDQYLSAIHVIESWDHGNECRLSASRGSDDAHRRACRYRQIDILKNSFLAVFIIAVVDVLKFDASCLDFSVDFRVFQINNINLLIQNLANTLARSHSA